MRLSAVLHRLIVVKINKRVSREKSRETVRITDGEQMLRVGEPSTKGLEPNLIDLKYHAVADAVAKLGQVSTIREMFIGFQKHLYAAQA